MDKTLIEKVKYTQCHNPQHKGQYLNLICTENQCNNMLLCALCNYQNHQKHNVVFAKKLLTEYIHTIQQVKIKKDQDSIKKILQTIQQKRDQVVKTIISLQEKFKELTEKIIIDLEKYYASYKQEILSSAKIQVDSQILTKDSLNKILLLKKFLTTDNLSSILDATSAFNKNTKKLQDSLIAWSEKYKGNNKLQWVTHSHIEVTDNKIKSIGAVTYKLAYLESSLRNEKRKFRIKVIQDSNNWVGVGICHKNKIELKEHKFNCNTVGHGCYMISSNGTVWTTLQPQINGCVKSFKFIKGDIIQIQYDPISKKVRFKKQGSSNPKDSYQISFQPSQSNDLRFGLLFYYLYDEIEMLNASFC